MKIKLTLLTIILSCSTTFMFGQDASSGSPEQDGPLVEAVPLAEATIGGGSITANNSIMLYSNCPPGTIATRQLLIDASKLCADFDLLITVTSDCNPDVVIPEFESTGGHPLNSSYQRIISAGSDIEIIPFEFPCGCTLGITITLVPKHPNLPNNCFNPEARVAIY